MKTNTKIMAACLAFAAGAFSLNAQTLTAPAPEETTSSSTITVTPAFVSEYMFRGMKLGGLCFQPTVEFASGNLAVGVWSSFPLNDKIPGVSDPEIDPYASYTIAINDSLSVVPGVTWYNYPDADKAAGFYKSTFEPSLAVNYTIGGVKFTPKVYYDLILEGATYELTAAVALPLKEIGTELDFAATVGTYKWGNSVENAAVGVKNWGDYWQAGVSMPYSLTKDSKVVLGFAYQEGSNNYYKAGSTPRVLNTAAVGRGFVSLSYSITF